MRYPLKLRRSLSQAFPPSIATKRNSKSYMITYLEESRRFGSIGATSVTVNSIQLTDIYTSSHLGDLPEVYDRHVKAVNKLESAENSLLKTAAKLHARNVKKEAQPTTGFGTTSPAPDVSTTEAAGRPIRTLSHVDPESHITLVEKLVPQKMRPTHRLPLRFMPFALPFVGKKIDSINEARDEIVITNELLHKARTLVQSESSGKALPSPPSDADSTVSNNDATLSREYPPLNSAFITFNKQIAAHLAKTALNHRQPYRMAGRYTEVAPEDIIWGNLGLHPYEAKGRIVISYGVTAGLVVLWAFPGEPSIVLQVDEL